MSFSLPTSNANDVRVVESLPPLSGLAVEPLDIRGVRCLPRREDLECHAAAHGHMDGQIHLAHPALRDLVEDLVRAEAEPLVFPLEEQLGLKGSEDAGLHQPGRRIRGGDREVAGLVREIVENRVVRKAGSTDQVQDILASVWRQRGHDARFPRTGNGYVRESSGWAIRNMA